MIEVLEALIKVIDLTLKRGAHNKEVEKDKVAYDLIALLIELERIEKQAKRIREYFFYIDRDKEEIERVKKHTNHLRDAIDEQISIIYSVNDRIQQFSPLLSIYMEEAELPHELRAALTIKEVYLWDTIYSLMKEEREDGMGFEFTSSYNSEEAMGKLDEFKRSLSIVIKEHVSIGDFVKWYGKGKQA